MSNSSQSNRRRPLGCLLSLIFLLSILANIGFLTYAFWPEGDDSAPNEKTMYGPKKSTDKIAVIRADGALIEGLDKHILQQIELAGRDPHVKAVVVRINSPGGTIGASEDIHRELTRIRSGQHPRFPEYKPKPLVASMGSIAASGGYYIAMPAEKVIAEKTTLTGSIGVYAALPNVSELAKNNGVKLELIKAGGIKGSGSPLHEMTPAERQPWQDMVDQAYEQFLDVVAKGRPQLSKEKLRSEVIMRKQANLYDEKGNVLKDDKGQPRQIPVERFRADGGTFTASEAKQFGLIDDIGLLEDAVGAAAAAAGLTEYRVVAYEWPPTLLSSLLGLKVDTGSPSWQQLSAGLSPRVWYMSPQCELSGIFAASSSK